MELTRVAEKHVDTVDRAREDVRVDQPAGNELAGTEHLVELPNPLGVTCGVPFQEC